MKATSVETWIEITGYEGQYAVSSHGRVMSLERTICGRIGKREMCRIIPERIMVQTEWHDYLQVWLRKPGEHRKYRVHRLVGEAFLPNPEGKHVVNHIDGNKGNNRIENLEWATYSENTTHYYQKLKPAFTPAVVDDEPIRDEDLPF